MYTYIKKKFFYTNISMSIYFSERLSLYVQIYIPATCAYIEYILIYLPTHFTISKHFMTEF